VRGLLAHEQLDAGRGDRRLAERDARAAADAEHGAVRRELLGLARRQRLSASEAVRGGATHDHAELQRARLDDRSVLVAVAEARRRVERLGEQARPHGVGELDAPPARGARDGRAQRVDRHDARARRAPRDDLHRDGARGRLSRGHASILRRFPRARSTPRVGCVERDATSPRQGRPRFAKPSELRGERSARRGVEAIEHDPEAAPAVALAARVDDARDARLGVDPVAAERRPEAHDHGLPGQDGHVGQREQALLGEVDEAARDEAEVALAHYRAGPPHRAADGSNATGLCHVEA
jgi:hypothetical protein